MNPTDTISGDFEGNDEIPTSEDLAKLENPVLKSLSAFEFNSLTIVVTNDTPNNFTLTASNQSGMGNWSPPQSLPTSE